MKRYKKTVACYYCPATFQRPQGRASHIRKSHRGMPYRPTPEQMAKYSDPPEPQPEATAPPIETTELPPPTDAGPMSPRQHLVAAISEVKQQLETVRRQIPELETHLESLRDSQSHIEKDLAALETALMSIDNSGTPPVQNAADPRLQPIAAGGARA